MKLRQKKDLYKESWNKKVVFKNINKINKPLANLTTWMRERTQINEIKDKERDITTNTNKIQSIIREYLKLYKYFIFK
jgi:hypothetical protein